MKTNDIKQSLKDKLKDCDKDTLIDIIADICSLYVQARVLPDTAINCLLVNFKVVMEE